jgi:hypothetical protein
VARRLFPLVLVVAALGWPSTAAADKPIHASCYTQFPLETSFENYVQSRLCVVQDKRSRLGRVYGFWKAWSPNRNQPHFQLAARLYVRLSLNGRVVARTREVVNPTTPVRLRTKSVRGGGRWCVRLRERTPLGFSDAAKRVCARRYPPTSW